MSSKTITVILQCWKRFQHFEELLKFWINHKEVGQVIVFDNSGKFKTNLPVLVLSASKNIGTKVRLNIAQFAKYDRIIFCDDDIEPKPGIVEDLLAHLDSNKIIGIIGKIFTGKENETYVNSLVINGRKITEPREVDYTPYNLLLTDRKHCLIDMKDCPIWEFIDDWWWEHRLKELNKNVSLWVIPTKNYGVYPGSSDDLALHKRPNVLAHREKYYQKWIKGKK